MIIIGERLFYNLEWNSTRGCTLAQKVVPLIKGVHKSSSRRVIVVVVFVDVFFSCRLSIKLYFWGKGGSEGGGLAQRIA